MASKTMTKRNVDAMKPGDLLWDGDVLGFGCRYQRRDRVYVLKYRHEAQQRWLSIGKHGSPWTVETARKEAKRLLGLVAAGKDPAHERDASKRDLTVAELCRQYLKEAPGLMLKRRGRPKKASTLAIDHGRVERHIIPLIGRIKANKVTPTIIESLQSRIMNGETKADIKTGKHGRAVVTGGPVAAARVVGLLGGIFSYALDRGIVATNPTRGVVKFDSGKRERYLSPPELARLGDELLQAEARGVNPGAIACIRLLALSGMRRNEALSLRWSDIDFERGLANLSDSKTGAKAVTLGAPALDLLRSLPRMANSPWVFPATKGKGYLLGLPKIWQKIRANAGLDAVRLHDLRHGFASAAVSGGQTLYVAGKLLGHAQARTTERYAHLADDPLRLAANMVAATIQTAMDGPAEVDGTTPTNEVK